MLVTNKIGAFGPKPSVPFLFALNMQHFQEAEMKDYIAQAVSTRSNQFHGHLVGNDTFILALKNAIDALNDLDFIKKALFYGKRNADFTPVADEHSLQYLHTDLDIPMSKFGANTLVNLLHGIIGKATEDGELLEALMKMLCGCSPDTVNIAEEVGDGHWYDAVIAHECGVTFDELHEQNIAKLRLRYPNKFTEYDALNRNLEAERLNLESNIRVADHKENPNIA